MIGCLIKNSPAKLFLKEAQGATKIYIIKWESQSGRYLYSSDNITVVYCRQTFVYYYNHTRQWPFYF